MADPGPLPVGQSGRRADEIALAAAKTAAELARQGWQGLKQTTHKGRGDVLTETDLAAQAAILGQITAEFPDHDLLAEEEGGRRLTGACYTWIVDPIDGTYNFSRGIGHFCVAIALYEGDRGLLGVVLDPARDEAFLAVRGAGATLNGVPIQASTRSDIRECCIGCDLGYDDMGGRRALAIGASLFPGLQSWRVMGSGALGLCYAACGRFDLYYHFGLYPWDIAAPGVILAEAGAGLWTWDGEPATGIIRRDSRGVIAAAQPLVGPFLETVDAASG